MKNHTLISLATIASLMAPWGIQADATPATIKTLEVECSTKTYFTDNECDICQDGGEISTTSTGAVINAQELTWENSLTGINQNFYKSGQPSAEIKTNIGTPTTNWDQTGLDWGTDVIFTKVDIQNIFSLEAGKTVKIKTIADKTNIPVTSIKDTTNAYLMVKVPIAYYELAMGATSQGDKKTTNYCISYTPKIITTGSTATTTPPATTPAVTTATTTTTPPPTTTTTTPVAPIPKPTTTTAPTTTTTPPPATATVPPKQIEIPTAAATTPPATTATAVTTPATTTPPKTTTTPTTSTTTPTSSTSTGITPPPTTTNTAIPAYNSNVKLNSAGPDPKIVAATKVASGPAENMYIFMAAVLLSALLYPKMRKITNKN